MWYPMPHTPRTLLSTRSRGPLAVLAVALAAPLLVAGPVAAQEPDEIQCPDPVPTEAQTEFEAVTLAELCDSEVEIVDEQTPWGTSIAQPDRTVRLSAALEPYRALDDSGQWAPVDTTLQVDADGMVRPVNAVSDMAFSGGGAGALAALSDGARSFALTWPQELPEPELDGATATYAEVIDGVDLVVTVSAEGFAHDLVVHSAEAAADPALEAIEFGFETSGLEAALNETGGIELTDAATGARFAGAPPPQMWDSSEPATGEEASTFTAAGGDEPAPVGVELDGSALRLIPDSALLEGQDTVYPVTIDPEWVPDTNGWITVSSRYKNNSYWKTSHLTEKDYFGDAGVGQSCDSSNPDTAECLSTPFRMRSYFRFNVSTVTQDTYRIPASARVYFLQKHSAVCWNGNMHLFQASEFHSASGDDWYDQPTVYASTRRTTDEADNGRGGCGGAAYVDFGIGSLVEDVDNREGKHLYLALRPPSETPSPDLRYWNRFDGSQARVEIVYHVLPFMPKQPTIDGVPCTSDPDAAPWINSGHPVLAANVNTKDSSVKWQVRVAESGSGGAVELDWTSGALAAGHRRSRTVQTELEDDSYYWLSRSISTSDSSIKSVWTAPCRFNVDHTKPTRPDISPGSTGPFEVGDSVEIEVSSADPVVNGTSSRIGHFEYSWNTSTFNEPPIPSDGTAVISREDLSAGTHVLYVRSVDEAGNESNYRAFTFFVGSDIEATPKAAWRFEGDTLDDTSHGFDLNPVDGSADFEADREGRVDSALTLDGNTCLSTDDGNPDTADAVVRTDAAFSISAWVRLDTASGYDKALVQAGSEHSAFQLQYSADADKWYFSMLSAPGPDFEWRSVGADATAAPSEWQHIAGTYDPDAGLTRIYIDGQLGGELPVSFTPWHEEHVTGLGCLLNATGGTSNHVTGAIDQVGIWQGLLTEEQIQASMVDLPTASEQAHWEFSDGGADDTDYDRDLALPDGIPVGIDPYQRPGGAVGLDGATCLEYPEAVVDSDRSFSVGGWVRLDALDANATVVSIAGEHRPGLRLRYAASEGAWQFVMHGTDAPESESSWLTVLSASGVEADRWYHLIGVFDAAAGEMRLYVDGQLQGTRTGPTEPWAADGPTVIGCAAESTRRWDHLTGSLHDVRLWRGPIDLGQMSEMRGDPPPKLAAWWSIKYNDASADESGNGHTLALTDGVEQVDGRDNAFNGALQFDGTGHATTSESVVATDESFTIASWVRVDDAVSDGVAVSMVGDDRSLITLKYSAEHGAWEFAAPPTDQYGWRVAQAPSATPGEWVLLVGVFDLAKGELRIYVDGLLAGTATDVVMPGNPGPVVIGAEGNADGTVRNHLIGAVDTVIVWQGALPDATIADIFDPELGVQ
ncbi:hypothetical protein GCM10029992_65680 [Glycomyces albus]